MGYFAEFAGFRAASPEDQVSALAALERAGFEQGLERDGWSWAWHPSGGEFEFAIDGFVTELARIAAGPAIGGWIFDSDLAVVAGAEPEGEGFRLTINDATGFADEDPTVAPWAQTTSSAEAIARSADGLATWSRHAPRSVAAATIIEWTPSVAILKPRETQRVHPPPDPERAGLFFGGANPWRTYEGEAYWKFAEDGVRLLFSLLGFPAFDQTRRTEQEPEADVEPAIGEGPPPLTDEQIALMKSVDAPHIVAGWRDWDGSVEQDDWWETMHESGWQSLNRHWVYARDVMRGQREYALLPEPADGHEGPPGLWIAIVTDEYDGKGPTALVLPIAPELALHRQSPHRERAKNDLAAGLCGRVPGEWAVIPDDIPRSQIRTFAWLVSKFGADG